MTTFDTKESLRAFVISTAATQAAIGAHYINGSDGGITGMNAVGEAGGGLSASRKIYLLEDYSWSKLAVHSAIYGGRVCKGRYDAVGGKKFLWAMYGLIIRPNRILNYWRHMQSPPPYHFT